MAPIQFPTARRMSLADYAAEVENLGIRIAQLDNTGLYEGTFRPKIPHEHWGDLIHFLAGRGFTAVDASTHDDYNLLITWQSLTSYKYTGHLERYRS